MGQVVEISDYPRFLCLGLSDEEKKAIHFLSQALMDHGNNTVRITELSIDSLQQLVWFLDEETDDVE